MSGGSYGYLYSRLNDLAEQIRNRVKNPASGDDWGKPDPLDPEAERLRLLFADLLDRAAKAAHDIEWVDSGDYGPNDEVESIRKALGHDLEGLGRTLDGLPK